jgi:hypothetical protein
MSHRTIKRLSICSAALLLVAILWHLAPDISRPEWVPKSARWVRSSESGFGLNYDAQVKFNASYRDCTSAAVAVIEAHQKEMRGLLNFNYGTKPIDVDRGRLSPEASFPAENKWWFRPERIKHGIYYGQNSSHNPQMWIDTDHGVFYYKRTD